MNDFNPNLIHKKAFALVGQKAIILNSENEILVLLRSDRSGNGGKWSLPGGGLEYSEDPLESIRREILEETQLHVSELSPYHVKSSINKNDEFVVMIGYQCKATTNDVQLNWEHDDFKWLTKEEAMKLDLTIDGRIFLEKFNYSHFN